MQQIDNLIKWAKEQQDVYSSIKYDNMSVAVAFFITKSLLPKLESCKTSPDSQSTPCLHPGCMSHVTHPCEGCGRQWPKF